MLSLKHNNRALACALTAEKEKSRVLEKERVLLQKEVNELNFQNSFLRHNLNVLNKMLKEIDTCMKTNLSTAIDLSTMQSSDPLWLTGRKSERVSRRSTLSSYDYQGCSLNGVPLRVPVHAVGQEKRNSHQPILVNEENLIVPSFPMIISENCDKLDELETHGLNLSFTEHPVCDEDRSRDAFSKVNVCSSGSPVDEASASSSRNTQSGKFVTRRKKRSIVSHCSAVAKKSDTNQARRSVDRRRDSSPTRQWELSTDVTILPESQYKVLADRSDSLSFCKTESKSPTLLCSSRPQNSDTDSNCDAAKEIYNAPCEDAIPSTNELEQEPEEESAPRTVDGYVGQETTVYEADMEMTSSEFASIIAVLSKKNTQVSKNKSGIPVKQAGTLRKVNTVREKTKKTESSLESQVKVDIAHKAIEKWTAGKPDRRTYVLPGSEDKFDVLESGTPSNLEVSAARESCVAGQRFPDNTMELNGRKSKLKCTLQKEHCTEAGNRADTAPKKRSKNTKESSNRKSSRTKESKPSINPKDEGQVAGEQDNLNVFSDQMDTSEKMATILRIPARNKEPKIRRETYVVSGEQQTAMTNDLISKVQGIRYRRETHVVPVPTSLVAVTLKTSAVDVRNNTLKEPKNDVNSLVPTIKSESEGERCNVTSNPGDACDYKKRVSESSQKATSSILFPELNKRKTYIVPSKQDDLRGKKATLVRESFVTRTSRQSDHVMFPDVGNKNEESFMLDMVSESVLDNSMDLSSFAEFPSATKLEGNFPTSMSLKRISTPKLPVTVDRSNKEYAQVSNDIDNLDDYNHQQTETVSYQQCKVEDQSMEIHEAANKPLQDLTNKSLACPKESSQPCKEEGSPRLARRKRNLVGYKEPSLRKKLRRGDRHTDTTFCTSPVAKQ
ncbi:hypothetical protein PRIEUP_LOCUS1396, partial [Pristimantis euphronides]